MTAQAVTQKFPDQEANNVNTRKYIAAVIALSSFLSLSGCAQEEPVEEPTFEEYQILKTYIEEEKRIKLRPTDHIETDLAFDSLDMVALQGFIQQTFGTDINAADMPRFKSIQALAEHIANSKTRMEVRDEDWNEFLHSSSSDLELPHGSITLSLLSKCSYLFFKVYNGLQIKGKENISGNGPVIIAPTHQSYLDGALVAAGMPTEILKDSYYYATEEHLKGSLRKAYARHSNIILM